jgi:hypothetical protein
LGEKSQFKKKKRGDHTDRHKNQTTQKEKKSHTQNLFKSMGITFAKLFQRLFSKKEMRILMVRDVLRSRDGLFGSRRACRTDGSFFFFSFFFFFPRK